MGVMKNLIGVKFDDTYSDEIEKFFSAQKEERLTVIGPNNPDEKQRKTIDDFIQGQKMSGKAVYCTSYHTDQNDDIGITICQTDAAAIMNSNNIAHYYDINIPEVCFNLGMAHILNKSIESVNPEYFKKRIGLTPPPKKGLFRRLAESVSGKRQDPYKNRLREMNRFEKFIATESGIDILPNEKDIQDMRMIDYEKARILHTNELPKSSDKSRYERYHMVEAVPADEESYFNLGMMFMNNATNGIPIFLSNTFCVHKTPKKSYTNVLLALDEKYNGHSYRISLGLYDTTYMGGLC